MLGQLYLGNVYVIMIKYTIRKYLMYILCASDLLLDQSINNLAQRADSRNAAPFGYYVQDLRVHFISTPFMILHSVSAEELLSPCPLDFCTAV